MDKTIFFIFFFITFVVFSQNEKATDSIEVLLNEYINTKKKILPQKAFLLAESTKNDSIIKQAYLDFGIKSYLHKDLDNLSFSTQKLLKHFSKTKDSFALAKHYHYKALFFRVQYKTDSLFYYYNKSKNISLLLKDSLAVARRLLSIAVIQNNIRDYLGSEITAIEGLRYIEPLNEKKYTVYLYNNLGNLLYKTGRYEEARKMYLKSIELNKENPDKEKKEKTILHYYNNVGLTYNKERKYARAKEFYKKGLIFDSLEYKFPVDYQNLLDNLAFNNLNLGNKEKALEGYLRSLKSKEKHKNIYGQSVSHSLLAEYYLNDNDFKKAAFHAKKGLEFAKQTNNNRRILENLRHLSKAIKGEKGKQYLEEYINLNDSLITRERNLKNQFAKVIYETEKKDKENSRLKLQNDKNQLEIEREKQQKTISWLITGGSVLLLVFGYSIAVNRRKKLLFDTKLQQVEVREKERQQIAKSLHDEVAGDIRMLHLKLEKANQIEEARTLDQIKENVRNLSHQLSSESFEEVSFKDQIINLASDYFEIDFRIHIEGIDKVDWKEVNNSIKRMLYLSIRESIQNAKKHAEASKINVVFNETKRTIHLGIKDNGKGFDVANAKSGIGLKNLKERVEEINGTFSIESELNTGTIIAIETPKK